MTRVLMLYRPRLPGQRAQAIQVVHAAHALARRGARVTLLADRSMAQADPGDALRGLGLRPVPGLDLRLAPVLHKGGAGLWFRAQVSAWSLGTPGIVWCRDLPRLRALTSVLPSVWSRHRIVLEVHGLDSGRSGEPQQALVVERSALRQAQLVVANCEGTAEAWQRAHAESLPGSIVVAHNAVAKGRQRGPVAGDGVVRVVGSLRPFKGWNTLWSAAGLGLSAPVEVVGGTAHELGCAIPAGVRVAPPVPYVEVPDLLARSGALVLPLADNTFGRLLTSPLKLFDYLATSVPLVLPELPSIHHALAAAGASLDGMFWYQPGDGAGMRSAMEAALAAGPRAPTVRTWDARLSKLLEASPVPLLGPLGDRQTGLPGDGDTEDRPRN